MLSRTNNYIAAMHTFEYGRFKGTFLQNHFSEKALRPIITGEHISKYFANPKKYFKSQFFSQITVEKFDKSKKLLQILRKFVDPQITFSIIRKYFANP